MGNMMCAVRTMTLLFLTLDPFFTNQVDNRNIAILTLESHINDADAALRPKW